MRTGLDILMKHSRRGRRTDLAATQDPVTSSCKSLLRGPSFCPILKILFLFKSAFQLLQIVSHTLESKVILPPLPLFLRENLKINVQGLVLVRFSKFFFRLNPLFNFYKSCNVTPRICAPTAGFNRPVFPTFLKRKIKL